MFPHNPLEGFHHVTISAVFGTKACNQLLIPWSTHKKGFLDRKVERESLFFFFFFFKKVPTVIFLQLKGTGAPHSLGTSQPWIAIIVPSCHREPLQHGTGVRTIIESSFISDAFSTEHSYMCFFLSFQVLGLMIYSKKNKHPHTVISSAILHSTCVWQHFNNNNNDTVFLTCQLWHPVEGYFTEE